MQVCVCSLWGRDASAWACWVTPSPTPRYIIFSKPLSLLMITTVVLYGDLWELGATL